MQRLRGWQVKTIKMLANVWKIWTSKTSRKTYRIASETSPWNTSSPTSSSLFPSKTLQTLQTFPSLAEPSQWIQFCMRTKNLNWRPLFQWSVHWREELYKGLQSQWTKFFFFLCSIFYLLFHKDSNIKLFSRKCEFDMKLWWGQFWISFLFWLQRNGRVALTYTIWTWARPWKAPAPIFFTHTLFNLSKNYRIFTHFSHSTYRICSWSSPLKAFGPTDVRWL